MRGGPEPRPVLFLDRDGTLIEDADYLADPDGVVLLPGAVEALARFRDAGWAVVVVTNQSGIARGLYGEADYTAVARRLETMLAARGVPLAATLHCPHHPDHSGPCACRKPAPGLLLAAARALALDLSRAVMVGDKVTDLQAGSAVGARPVLVRTGYGAGTASRGGGGLPEGTVVVDGLIDVADHVLGPARRVDREDGPG